MTWENQDPLFQEYVIEGELRAADYHYLREVLGQPPDLKRLNRWLRRRTLGEPLEYITGFQTFRSRRFSVDKRVYITDSELTHLVDSVVEAGRSFLEKNSRPPVIVEFGVGCGSLAVSVKRELPEARVIGLDIDSDAIVVAQENARHHHVDIELLESDFFSDLPSDVNPDVIFGDPPWGDDDCLYHDDRSAAHYQAMPLLSAFPPGGITAVHESLLREVASQGWSAEALLNLGVLGDDHIERLTSDLQCPRIIKFDNTKILHCIFS